jgi:DNA-binding CsgD family transcriptional regulator
MDGAVGVVVERPRSIELAPVVMRALGFTRRERQVAEELLRGSSRRQLARRLALSEHTVGDHLQNLYRKADVSGRAELAALLFGRHYLPPRSAGVPPSPYGYFVGLDGAVGRFKPVPAGRQQPHGDIVDDPTKLS